MGYWLKDLFRRWAGLATLLDANTPYAAAQLACCAVPAEFYLFTMPVPPGVDEPPRRVLLAPHIEVDIDGLWLIGDVAE